MFGFEKFSGNGETALVVEDMADQQEITVEMLNALGYRAEAVGSGEAAVEHIRNNSVGVVILDMNLGSGMDGLATFREICRVSPSQKAILATGFATADIFCAAEDLGICACLKKPYSVRELARIMRLALDT
ncbi:MAG: response regulator [Deltaproteobacteria bacterium]|nr:response regulator [Deltaproteobacteria bacterium]